MCSLFYETCYNLDMHFELRNLRRNQVAPQNDKKIQNGSWVLYKKSSLFSIKTKLRLKTPQNLPTLHITIKKDSTESIKIKNLQQTLPTELQEVILDFKKAVIDTLDNYERKTCKKNPRPERDR